MSKLYPVMGAKGPTGQFAVENLRLARAVKIDGLVQSIVRRPGNDARGAGSVDRVFQTVRAEVVSCRRCAGRLRSWFTINVRSAY